MSKPKFFDRLDSREQRMLRGLLGVAGVLALVLIPVGTEAMLSSTKERNEALRAAINEITTSQASIAKAEQKRQLVVQRYARPAPPLAAFLDGIAKESGIEIPESQDRPVVPHGKRYEERATRLELRKTSLGSLAHFLEKIEQSGFAVVVSKLNIRKRLNEPDSFDVELMVSAYDRKEAPKGSEGGSGEALKTDGAGADGAVGDALKDGP